MQIWTKKKIQDLDTSKLIYELRPKKIHGKYNTHNENFQPKKYVGPPHHVTLWVHRLGPPLQNVVELWIFSGTTQYELLNVINITPRSL